MKNYIVYKHTCPDGKVYIGITSMNSIERWGKNGKGYKGQLFGKVISKYGWDNIKHEILFTDLTKEEAERKEIELIKKYKCNMFNYGYNVKSGGHCGGCMHVCQYEKDGTLVNTYLSASDAANKTGISIDAIRYCCTKNRKKSFSQKAHCASGYVWWYENDKIAYIRRFIGH